MSPRSVLTTLAIAGISVVVPAIASAQCNQCGNENKCCCRPNVTKIIYRRPLGLVGAPAPQGFAVSSVPAVMVTTPALAIHPATISAASFSQADLDRAVDAAVKRQAAAAAAPTPASNNTCDDACGRILQLRRDVDDLIVVTRELARAVDKLADNQKKTP